MKNAMPKKHPKEFHKCTIDLFFNYVLKLNAWHLYTQKRMRDGDINNEPITKKKFVGKLIYIMSINMIG